MSQGEWLPQLKLLVLLDQTNRALVRAGELRERLRLQSRQAKAELEAHAHELEQLGQQQREGQQAQQKLEAELTWTETRLSRLRDMAHVTSTKELELAQRDLLSLQKRKDELEELILAQLEQAEKEANRLTFLKNSLPLKKKQLTEGQAERKQQFEAEGASIERLKLERETLLGQLQAELKTAYQFAYQLHGERACLTVQDGGCPHCHLPIQPQFVVNILLGRSFHICQSCKRLVLPDRPLD